MRNERLQRTRDSLRSHGLAAALLCDPLNVRYAALPAVCDVFSMHVTSRWLLVPVESDPVLWEYADAMHVTEHEWAGDLHPARGWTFFGSGSRSAADATRFAAEITAELRERGILGEPLGLDRLEAVGYLALTEAGVKVVDAQSAMEQARAIKTYDELTVIRRNARSCDDSIAALLGAMQPGVTEDYLWGTLVGTSLKAGALWCETRLLSSGPRTNPWMQEASARVVHEGELVAFDTDLVGEDGYLTDVSRTYLCGDKPPTDEQRRLYQASYAFLHTALPQFRAGASFEELGRRIARQLPEEFQQQRYPFVAHGTGMVDEYPCVNFVDHHEGQLEVGMVMSVESYVGAVGGAQGVKLEEQVVITADGPEPISTAPYDQRLLG
nr:Xaa-Pro peptidase family protein [Leekyejoonella antrihumi]